MKTNKYDQLNILTLIAMFMLYSIHFFNIFHSDNLFFGSEYIIYLLRAISFISVPLYIAIAAYTYIYLDKNMKISKLFLYILIPTILLSQIRVIISPDFTTVTWNWTLFHSGTYGSNLSWFGDMYMLLMLSLPFFKQRITNQNLMILIAFSLALYGYTVTVGNTEPMGVTLGMLTFVPYVGMIYLFNFLIYQNKFKNNLLFFTGIIISVFLLAIAYAELVPFEVTYIKSYFSPIAFICTACLVKLIYNTNFRIPYLRYLTRSSYFFYFTSYYVLDLYSFYIKDILTKYPVIMYLLGAILAMILSFSLYFIYQKLLLIWGIEKDC